MTIRIATEVTVTWDDGGVQSWTNVKAAMESNQPGSLPHPLRPTTDYIQLVLLPEEAVALQ